MNSNKNSFLKNKRKKALRVSACCSHHRVIITGKRRSACCDQSTIGGCGASAAHLTFNGHGDVATAMVGPINEDAQDDKDVAAAWRSLESCAPQRQSRQAERALGHQGHVPFHIPGPNSAFPFWTSPRS